MALMCPQCGWQYDPHDWPHNELPHELVPIHSQTVASSAVCLGTGQHPRNPETDRRPLWKDGGVR